MVTVCTILPPPERARLDAAGDGCFTALHADSFHDVLDTARRQRVDALVISVHRCGGVDLPAVARFVREFPAIPAVALVSRHDGTATEALLRLGATGVRTAVDCTEPGGWSPIPPHRWRRASSAGWCRRWRAYRTTRGASSTCSRGSPPSSPPFVA